MSKTACIIWAIVGITSLANAQRTFRLGLTATPILSWLRPDNDNTAKGKIRAGLEYGLMADIMFSDNRNYGIFSGIILSLEGGNMEPHIPFLYNNSLRLKYQYVQIPVALKLRTDRFADDQLAIYGNFGLSNNFRIASKADIIINGTSMAENESINKKFTAGPYHIKSRLYDFSLLAGAGIEFFITENTSLIGGVVYNHGFTNIIKDNTGNKVTLSNIGLRLGLMF